jgi:autotransporter-associated beta strand protein
MLKSHSATGHQLTSCAALGCYLISAVLPAAGDTLYWDGASGNWTAATNWSTVSNAPTPDPAAVPGALDDTVFNITGANANSEVSLNSGNRSANSMTFVSSGTTFLRRSSTDGTSANTVIVGPGGITMASGAGAVTFGTDVQRVNMRAAASLGISNNSSSLLTFNRGVSSGETSGTTTITLDGSGTGGTAFAGSVTDGTTGAKLALRINTTGGFTYLSDGSANTYTGGTTLDQGVLALRSSNSLGSGTLTINGGTFGSVVITRNFSNDVTINNGFQLGGVAVPNLDSTATTFNGTIDLAGGIRTITLGNSATFANAVTNGGLELKSLGNFSLTLSGTSTYTGNTLVSSGTLLITGALGATDVTVADGATIGGSGVIAGDLTLDAGARLNLTGATFGIDNSNILSVGESSTITLTSFGFTSLIGWDWANAEVGTYTLINGGNEVILAGTTPTLLSPFDFGNGRKGYFQEGSLQAVIIPEPAAALLGSLGVFGLLRRRRE